MLHGGCYRRGQPSRLSIYCAVFTKNKNDFVCFYDHVFLFFLRMLDPDWLPCCSQRVDVMDLNLSVVLFVVNTGGHSIGVELCGSQSVVECVHGGRGGRGEERSGEVLIGLSVSNHYCDDLPFK